MRLCPYSHRTQRSFRLSDIGCIPCNKEKYITFHKAVHVHTITTDDDKEAHIYSRLKFVEAMRFMKTSLEKLVGNSGNPGLNT